MSDSIYASNRSQLLILASVCLAALVLPLSFSGGAIATPAIGRELGGSPVALTWVTNAFMLTFGSLLMAAGALADEYGRKRLFIIGMSLFILVSLALSLSPGVLWLDVLRAVQGMAAAAALAGGSAALAQEFDGHQRTTAFSLLGTSFGIGLAFGPLLAGVLIDTWGWRAIFVMIAAISALALLFGAPRMRETRDPDAAGLDWPGTLSFSAALACFTWGVIQAPESGWSSPLVIGLLVATALLLIAFMLIESRVARPMLDLSLLRYPRFVGVQILPIGTCYCYIVLIVLLPLRFIGMQGLSEIDTGLLMLALSAPMLIVPVLVASLTRWISAGVLCGIGFILAALGLYWLKLVSLTDAGQAVAMPLILIGIGAGMPWGLMDGLAISVVPKERAGMATGIFNTTRVAGEGIALAIAVAMLAAFAHSALVVSLANDGVGISLAAQRVAAGDLLNASALLPEVNQQLLIASYDTAFQGLLSMLIGITLLAALATFLFLSRTPVAETATA